MSFKINSIKVRNFRGVRCISVPVEGQNLIVVGENGAGKSSIVDALEFFFTGRIAPLEGRSDVDKRRCIPNLRGGPTEIQVAFRGVGPKDGVTIGYPRRRAVIPKSVRSLFDIADKQTFVLRRYQVLRFINSRDAERYQQISQLIGLAHLDVIDARWRSEWLAAKKQVETLNAGRDKIFDRLTEHLQCPIRSLKELIHASNALLADQQLRPINSQEELAQRLRTLRRRSRFHGDITQAERLYELQTRITNLAQVMDDVFDASARLNESVQAFWEISSTLDDAKLEPLLSAGYRILQDQRDVTNCPLCEKPITDYVAFLRRLEERLTQLRAVSQRRANIEEHKAILESSLVALTNLLFTIDETLAAHRIDANQGLMREAQDALGRWRASLIRPDWHPGVAEKWHEHPSISRLKSAMPELGSEVLNNIQRLIPTKAGISLLDLLVTFTRVDEQWRQLEEIELELRGARYIRRQIDLTYSELLAARKRGLERLRQALEEDFERFYQQLHPDEGYEAITIPVQHDRRSSIALRARFQTQDDAHPLNYFSEGHLDSLGLCIFLAFIKHFNQDLKFIVLDDVLTTVDAGHRLRVARLLAREFPDYQLIITTHDQLWAKELERVLPNVKLVPLKTWSLDQGADCWQQAPSDWEYYEQQARDGRPQDAIAGAGRNLEKFLFQMRGNLGLAIPAKPNDDYTIGDLYPPFFSWVNKHPVERPDNPHYAQELEALENELDQVWRLRNWSGAHFNAWAETVSTNEALSFLDAIQRLVAAFECPVCHSLVCYSINARALICPTCDPSPPARVTWQYRPGWHTQAIKLMQAHKRQVRSQAVPMAQSTFAGFMTDARHRLGFPLTAEPFDRYGVAVLYQPFFDWVVDHPCTDANDWQSKIAACKQALDVFWLGEGWAEVPDSDTESLVDAVQGLISLFECATCSQLLDYDRERAGYYCTNCSGQEEIPSPVSACWFVIR